MIVVRTDASPAVGLGHLRRCVTLARRLRAEGEEVHFLAKTTDIDPAAEISAAGAAFVPVDPALAGQADAAFSAEYCRKVGAKRLIVDHYHADEAYQRVLLEAGLRWLQFDGAAVTPQWADWVVSMSPAASPERYRELRRRPETALLIGPRYAVLRDEFANRNMPHAVSPVAARLFLSFGGGDDRGAALMCLEALAKAGWTGAVDIVSGSANPRLASIRERINGSGNASWRLHVDAGGMADLMAAADLAIISGGTTSFEAAALGLPSMLVQIADNQSAISTAWERLGAAVDLGPLGTLDPGRVAQRILELCRDPQRRQAMASAGAGAVDSRGAERIAGVLTDSVAAASGHDPALAAQLNLTH